MIGNAAFCESQIETISIPPTVSEFCNGWCEGTVKLVNVKIMSNNKQYKNYEDYLIIGKSGIEGDEYDVLVFANRNITKANFPPTIKRFAELTIQKVSIPKNVSQICEGAFFWCEKLQAVEIPPDSELQLIDKYAFAETLIESIFIP